MFVEWHFVKIPYVNSFCWKIFESRLVWIIKMFVTYCDRIQNIAQVSKMCMYNIILLPHPLINQKAVVELLTVLCEC